MKTQKFLTVLACCLGAVFASQAQAKYQIDDQNDGYFATADDFLKAQSRIHRSGKLAGGMEDAVRLKAVEDYAKSVAMQASIRNHMREVSQTISSNSRNLDAIYDFSPLMIQGKVVPPVVVEAVDLYNQSGKMQVRLTDRVYEIYKQAHIASTAPNWRDYLSFSNEADAYQDYVFATAGLKPKGALEKKVWDKATREGWEIGKKQANTILLESMDRLNRDYIGMVRFHQLAAEGKLQMPAMSSYDLSDSTDGIRLLMGEKLLQITSLPQFKTAPSAIQKQFNRDVSYKGYLSSEDKVAVTDTPLEVRNPPAVLTQVFKAQNDIPVIDEPRKQILNQFETIQSTDYSITKITTKVIGEVLPTVVPDKSESKDSEQ